MDFAEIIRAFSSSFWIWIPMVAILAGMFTEWLKFKEKQSRLGASTEQVGTDLAQLRQELAAENARLRRRVENLETIVTSQAWDEVQPPRQAALEPPGSLLTTEGDLGSGAVAETARIAGRLRD